MTSDVGMLIRKMMMRDTGCLRALQERRMMVR